MKNADIKAKLEELEKIKAKTKERLKRYHENQKSKGKRQISALISGQAYEIICKEREKSSKQGSPLSVADILEKALTFMYTINVNSNTNCDTDINTHGVVNNNELKNKSELNAINTNSIIPDVYSDEIERVFEDLKLKYAADNTHRKISYKQALIDAKLFLKQEGHEWTNAKISDELNIRGLKTTSGGVFSRDKIRDLDKNYKGAAQT